MRRLCIYKHPPSAPWIRVLIEFLVARFFEADLTLDNYWRAIILYGRNVASYKFALAKSLLELSDRSRDTLTLEELAEPFARHLSDHLKKSDKQATSQSSRFLDTVRAYNRGELSHEELVEATARLGFVNVIDAFHTVAGDEIGVRFFIDERTDSTNGIRLTDELRRLAGDPQYGNLLQEIEARWRLVETAWELGLPRSAVTIDYDPSSGLLLPDRRRWKRPAITASRDALNGYQKGKCFYCFAPISVEAGSPDLADVDHFFPHALKPHETVRPIDGVWNLVLACQGCNRGPRGKFDRLPAPRHLERLSVRNDFLIGSHHPLRETLIEQTGATARARHSFLQRAYSEAQALLIHTWSPGHEHEPAF